MTDLASLSFQNVLDAIGPAVLILNQDAHPLYLNPSAERLAVFSLHQPTKSLFEIFSDLEDLKEPLRTLFETGHAFTIREKKFQNTARQNFVAELTLNPIYNDQGNIAAASLMLSESSAMFKIEEEHRKQDRLHLLGTIASGLAHEIRNPLGGIKGAAQLLKRDTKDPDTIETLGIIVHECNRINRLVTELLDFTKPKTHQYRTLNIHTILDEILALEESAEKNSGIQFIRQYDPSLPDLEGDPFELKQVFLNLIKNAAEAVLENPEKNSKRVKINTRICTDYQLKTKSGKRTRLIVIEITDTGLGMSDEVQHKLFAPFYTTKLGGTGLGLAVVQRIVDEHQGLIQVESELNEGSSFKVFLRSSR